MTAEQLREFKRKVPFKPFTIHMTDGTVFKIDDPETLVLPNGWTADAIVTAPRGRFSFVYLKNVTHVSGQGPWPKVRGRRGRGGGEFDG